MESEGGELEEGGQKVHTSSCKMNKYWKCNVQHDATLYSHAW